MSNLSQYFSGIAMKRIVSGELPLDPSKGRTSTQHEFNSTKELIRLFGDERIECKPAIYFYFSDKEEHTLVEPGTFSFYNSREGKPRSPEYRFYYNAGNSVVTKANEGDVLFIGKTLDDKELFIIVERNSTVEQQMMFLFGMTVDEKFQVRDLSEEKSDIGFIEKYILENIGIEIDESKDYFLDEMLDKFDGTFPRTVEFSKFARSKVKGVDPIDDPDSTLLKWFEMEYELFKTLEKYLIVKKLESGFGEDGKNVEDFLKYSLSIHQRRKSRSGDAFENHLEEIFICNNIRFTAQARLGKAKPDFIFPGVKYYNNDDYSVELLTMLGAKTTAKERWKQLLPESKISPKHFITLEPAISKNQTDDMAEKGVQLIIPANILPSYNPLQQKSIITFKDFIYLVRNRQTSAGLDE